MATKGQADFLSMMENAKEKSQLRTGQAWRKKYGRTLAVIHVNAHTDCTHLHACIPVHRRVTVKKIYISSKVYDETKRHLKSNFHANIWAIQAIQKQ